MSKIANQIAKKKQSGVTSLIGIDNLDPVLEKIEINDVWGVGKQLTKFYQKHIVFAQPSRSIEWSVQCKDPLECVWDCSPVLWLKSFGSKDVWVKSFDPKGFSGL